MSFFLLPPLLHCGHCEDVFSHFSMQLCMRGNQEKEERKENKKTREEEEKIEEK
jgi:hypothetical protein